MQHGSDGRAETMVRHHGKFVSYLRVSTKRNLPKRGHGKQTAQRVECLFLEYRIRFFKIGFQPGLERK